MSRLPIPAAALSQHVIALGKTRAGKSSKLRVLVEWLLSQGKPACIIDPKGDWWGLKSSADGKTPGFPVVIFGGKHADLPLNPRAGAAIAELIFTGNRPCVIDTRELRAGERTRWFIDFAQTAFRVTTGERYLVIDEVHNFAPKGKVLSPEAGEMLHWANRLASEGLGLGLTLLAASQRPQKVHNDLLTSCETLIACRVIHKADRTAIADWIDGCADPETGKEVLRELATMPRPEAWVWSPEVNFGPKRIEFPMFATYDSFKPQAAGGAQKLKGWAEVDLAVLRTQLQVVVAEAEANDPKTLRLRIQQLEAALAKRSKEHTVTAPTREELHSARDRGFADGHKDAEKQFRAFLKPAIAAVANEIRKTMQASTKTLTDALDPLTRIEITGSSEPPAVVIHRTPQWEPIPALGKSAASAQRPAPSSGTVDRSVLGNKGAKRSIMIALAQHGPMLPARLAMLAGVSSKGGSWSTWMSSLRVAGFIADSSGTISATDAGIEALGSYEPLPSGDLRLDYWRRRVGNGARLQIFNALIDCYPRAMSAAELAQTAGVSCDGGSWSTWLSSLRTMELITGTKELRASEALFS